MKKGLMKLPKNRVRRNYLGGAGIDALQGAAVCADNNMPEEWVGSMVEASNPGMAFVEHEGLTEIGTEQGTRLLRELVDEEREFYLGESIHRDGSWQLSFLLKILDSAMRLHVQVHPTTQFAKDVMHKPYGKLECYFILGVRAGSEAYIRLGFQHAPTKEAWREMIETQDKARMDGCFEKIPVKPGEVWYIPGGMPHAIGEGITMLEIMEPSDLVVRCEFEREGIIVPADGRFMGRGLDFCLDIFDYQEYTKEQVTEKCRITPELLENREGYERQQLVNASLTACFFVDKIKVQTDTEIVHNRKFTLGVVCEGECRMETEGGSGSESKSETGSESIELKRGDSFLIAAAVERYRISTRDGAELALVYPGSDMEE